MEKRQKTSDKTNKPTKRNKIQDTHKGYSAPAQPSMDVNPGFRSLLHQTTAMQQGAK